MRPTKGRNGAMGRWIRFRVPGDPTAKQRPKFVRRGRHTKAITPERTKRFEDRMRDYAYEAMGGQALLQGPVGVRMMAVWVLPKSQHRKKVPRPATWKISTPDLDNVVKVLDSCNGIVWQDDSLVVRIEAEKRYAPQGEGGYLEVEIYEVEEETP